MYISECKQKFPANCRVTKFITQKEMYINAIIHSENYHVVISNQKFFLILLTFSFLANPERLVKNVHIKNKDKIEES